MPREDLCPTLRHLLHSLFDRYGPADWAEERVGGDDIATFVAQWMVGSGPAEPNPSQQDNGHQARAQSPEEAAEVFDQPESDADAHVESVPRKRRCVGGHRDDLVSLQFSRFAIYRLKLTAMKAREGL